jgi:hydroxymethylpyrimidine/phosphomethylpyrimidine kinase
MSNHTPIVLTIAGSDCSSGAGIQADLKTFTSLGCYGLTAVTCVVAEVPGQVISIQSVNPDIVRDQIAILFETFSISAVKTGMLFSQAIVNAIADVFESLPQLPPLVVDPVMIASSGDTLLEPDAVEAYRERLFPLSTLITPNLDELYFLSSAIKRPESLHEMKSIGQELLAKTKRSLLLKGGHLNIETATDLLLLQDGTEYSFSAPFLRDVETHGTGCTYAAAITAYLAQGDSLPDAVSKAKKVITNAISNAYRWNQVSALKVTLQ